MGMRYTRGTVWTCTITALLLLAAALGAVTGCGSDASTFPEGAPAASSDASTVEPPPLLGDGGSSADAVTRIFFDPPKATIALDGTGPKSTVTRLKVERGNGNVTDAPASARFQVDRPDLATASASNPVTLTASGPYAGTAKLRAIYGGREAVFDVTVSVHLVSVGTGVDSKAVSDLEAPNLPPDQQLTSLLYPYDATVFPLGMRSPKLMWNALAAADVYKLRVAQKHFTYELYTKAPSPASLRIDQPIWDAITSSNGGDPVDVSLSRWDQASQTAYSSAHQSWKIAPANLRGAIYYWTVSNGGHMARIRPGVGAQPEVLNGGTCMGCHAVSADGSTLIAALHGAVADDGAGDNRAWASFDLGDGTSAPVLRKQSRLFSGNVAVSPDGTYVVSGLGPLKLSKSATGTVIANSGLGDLTLSSGMQVAAHPAFSPDGKRLAVVQSNANWVTWNQSVLTTLQFSSATETFSTPTNLVNGTSLSSGMRAIAYPTFTPDSSWIAFHASDYATGCTLTCDAEETGHGAIWLESAAGGAPIRLSRLTDGGVRTADENRSFEPTFNPVERGGYFWVVFTSTRDWGNSVTGTPKNGKKRLWVAAIDKNPGTADPSHPAFFLEGQEETTINMRGFWSLAACVASGPTSTCSIGAECCSGFCRSGHCVDPQEVACRSTGDACTSHAQCCNAGATECRDGACAIVPPR